MSPHTSSDDLEKAIAGIKEILLSKKEKIQTYSVYLQEINNDNAIIMIIYFTRFGMSLDDLNQLKAGYKCRYKKTSRKVL